MTNLIKPFILLLFLVLWGWPQESRAQFRGLDQEIGVVVGPMAFFSDYGLRYNLRTNTGNTGYGIGLVHYIRFALNDACGWNISNPYLNDHFKLRTEFDYHRTDLKHYGEVASANSDGGRQLRAMTAQTEVYELGAHLEYFPFSIRDFTEMGYPFAPFVSLGASMVRYDPETTIEPGNGIFHKFQGGINDDPGATYSVTVGGGVRYKISWKSDLLLSFQYKYYGSDFMDGLDHDDPSNKANDAVFWLNLGYIFYLDL